MKLIFDIGLLDRKAISVPSRSACQVDNPVNKRTYGDPEIVEYILHNVLVFHLAVSV